MGKRGEMGREERSDVEDESSEGGCGLGFGDIANKECGKKGVTSNLG